MAPEVVDGIVFWTKNPAPMIKRLAELEKYNYYFQFTLTPYGPEIERNLPSKNKVIIPTFQTLSREIGKEKVIWRYDPIFLNNTYTMEYHCRYFEVLASKLSQYTQQCTISFIDMYKKTERNVKEQNIRTVTEKEQAELVERFAAIADQHQIAINTCAEAGDFERLGVSHACCVDKKRLERIGNYHLHVEKDRNQRQECGCAASIDIGAYDTCKNGCLYCYANANLTSMNHNYVRHHAKLPLLFGEISEDDTIIERKAESFADRQMTLFDFEKK